MKRLVLCIFLLTKIACFGQGEDDHINWSYNKYSFAIDDKWKMDILPKIRLNQNFTNLQNAMIDYKIKRPIGHGVTLGVLGRTWFIPNEKMRQFIWFDIDHKIPTPEISLNLSQRLRYHWGLDINDRIDRDFLRYRFVLGYIFDNCFIQPFIGAEPFFRLNGVNYFERLRTEFGFNFKANKNLTLTAFLSKEDYYDLEDVYTNFLWFTGMSYTFDQPLFKEKKIEN